MDSIHGNVDHVDVLDMISHWHFGTSMTFCRSSHIIGMGTSRDTQVLIDMRHMMGVRTVLQMG